METVMLWGANVRVDWQALTSLVSRSIDHCTKGTFQYRDERHLYRKRGVLLQLLQFCLEGTVFSWWSSSTSAVLPISNVLPNSANVTSLTVSEAEFADNSVQSFWRGGLELDHDWCGASVIRLQVYRWEIWGWVSKKIWISLSLQYTAFSLHRWVKLNKI